MASVKEICGDIVIPADGKFIIPNTVTWIEPGAFRDCKGLVEVVIPDSVERIESCAFSGCCNLKKITGGKSIRSIGFLVFEGCSNLKSITIPASVETIDSIAFKGCIPDSINVDSGNKLFYAKGGCLISKCSDYDSSVDKNAGEDRCLIRGCKGISAIPDGVTTIEPYALAGLDFNDISIPDSVVTILMHAFEDCTSLKRLTLPESVGYIDSYAFSGCTSLEYINIPAKIRELDQGLFSGCISLSEIHIPDNVIVNADTFEGCKNLRKIHIPNFREPLTVAQNDIARIFKDCNLDEITISTANKDYKLLGNCVLDKTGKKLILGCNKSVIPETVEEIGRWAFNGCTKLTELTIPDNVKRIEMEAFHGCTSLKSVNLPNGLIEIGIKAFYDCSALEKTNLPESLEKIGDEAFGSCYKLNNISVTAQFDKDNISFEHDSFRGAPAAKTMGLWNGKDHKAFWDKLFKKIAKNRDGK